MIKKMFSLWLAGNDLKAQLMLQSESVCCLGSGSMFGTFSREWLQSCPDSPSVHCVIKYILDVADEAPFLVLFSFSALCSSSPFSFSLFDFSAFTF